MEFILKTLHYFSILFAGGVTVGGGIIQSACVKAGDTPPPFIGKAFAVLGYIGLGSILTLWVTGVGFSRLIYGSLAINGAFLMRLLGAAIVLLISAYANLHVYQAIKARRPPNGPLMKRLFQAGRVGLVLAIGGAAVAFSS
tara:strand:- start:6 stop:428 length:423 start_codon:yes stop_codon:yes gene_type:complete